MDREIKAAKQHLGSIKQAVINVLANNGIVIIIGNKYYSIDPIGLYAQPEALNSNDFQKLEKEKQRESLRSF